MKHRQCLEKIYQDRLTSNSRLSNNMRQLWQYLEDLLCMFLFGENSATFCPTTRGDVVLLSAMLANNQIYHLLFNVQQKSDGAAELCAFRFYGHGF